MHFISNAYSHKRLILERGIIILKMERVSDRIVYVTYESSNLT